MYVNQIKIQDYWFFECDADTVVKSYKIDEHNRELYEKILGIVIKSRKVFLSGDAFINLAKIDKRITKEIHYNDLCMKK